MFRHSPPRSETGDGARVGRVSESNLQRTNVPNTNTHKVTIVTQQIFSSERLATAIISLTGRISHTSLAASAPYRLPAHISFSFDSTAHLTTGVNGTLERRTQLIRTMTHKRYPITWRIVFLITTVLKCAAVFASTETNSTCEPDWATDAYCDPRKCRRDYEYRARTQTSVSVIVSCKQPAVDYGIFRRAQLITAPPPYADVLCTENNSEECGYDGGDCCG